VEFFAQLPFLLLGTVDASGQPRASLLTGPGRLRRLAGSRSPCASDALPNDSVAIRGAASRSALLGIELPTKRRNRLNGEVESVDARGFHGRGAPESFGKLSKYIHARDVEVLVAPPTRAGRDR